MRKIIKTRSIMMLKAIYQNICQFIVNYCDKLFSSTMTKACLYKILYSIPEKVG